jgi:hypothetical protein
MHDERNAKPKAEPAAETPKKQMAEEDSGGDIKQIVAENGPAKEMHYHHDEATNKHHVHSKHGEKEHKSEHDSPEEAADQMQSAMGQSEEPSDEEMGEEAGEAMPEMESASGRHIPGL